MLPVVRSPARGPREIARTYYGTLRKRLSGYVTRKSSVVP